MSARERLSLTEDLTIYHALDQKKILLDALSTTDELLLDLSQVGEIDAAGLQLLILLKQEAPRAEKSFRIVAPSPAVSDMIDFCNLTAEFGDPLLIAASATS